MSTMNEHQIAGTRMARYAIKLAQVGDIETAQALIKTADSVYQGHNPVEALQTFWGTDGQEKVAEYLNEIISQPSDVAKQRHQFLKEAKAQLVKEAQQRAAQQSQPLQTLFGKSAADKKKV